MLETIKTNKKCFIASCVLFVLGAAEVYLDFRVFEALVLGIPYFMMVLCSKYPSLLYGFIGLLLLISCLCAKRATGDLSILLLLLISSVAVLMMIVETLFLKDVFSVGKILSQDGQYSQEIIKAFGDKALFKFKLITWYSALFYSIIIASVFLVFDINRDRFGPL